jgi:hypothetical protein
MPQYECVNCNQHGARFKKKTSKRLNIARLSCKRTDASDLSRLILLSHSLNVPVHYDFEDQEAYIEVVSADVVKDKI